MVIYMSLHKKKNEIKPDVHIINLYCEKCNHQTEGAYTNIEIWNKQTIQQWCPNCKKSRNYGDNMMNKMIKIFTGSNPKQDLFELKLHPQSQIEKVRMDLKVKKAEYSIYTNSPYVTEAFNKFGKEKGYKILMYFDGEEMDPELIFEKFGKPFHNLIFD